MIGIEIKNKTTNDQSFFAGIVAAIDSTFEPIRKDHSETLTGRLNSMIAAGVSFDVSIDDFQVFGADNLTGQEKQFLAANKMEILCTLQQGLLVKYLFSHKTNVRQIFISEVNERGASFEAVSEITVEWFARLLDTIQ